MPSNNTLSLAPSIRLTLTKEIIESAVARNSNHCMVAEALKESHPHLQYISVDIQPIRATDIEKMERYVWLTPRQIQLAIINFDQGKKPEPCSVRLNAGQTTRAGGGASYKERKKAKLRVPNHGHKQSVPSIVGGIAPPKSVGRRRAFGLRSLQY